jgi:glucose/arabinose dehydrogenase
MQNPSRRPVRALAVAALTLAAVGLPATAQQPFDEVESVLVPGVGPISIKKVTDGLESPWGMDFLPDGRLLITEKPGRLRLLEPGGQLSAPLEGVPEVWAQGQGGLMDVAAAPDFEQTQEVYLSYAKPGADGTATTALGRGQLTDGRIEGFEDIFVEKPYVQGPNHFGNRIVFSPDGRHLFLALGDRFKFDPAQDLTSHLGSVVRLNRDGSVPEDNPFAGRPDASPEIWSYGHRNIEAAAIDPATGALWVAEMGPLGGDELNQPEPGRNYGWPEVSWGMHYDGRPIPDPTAHPEFADAVKHWSPVISPSGMVFYSGEPFSAWQGMAIIGGLSARDLVLVRIEDGQVTEEQRIPLPDRIRDVAEGPDGLVYILIDRKDGALWRAEPMG